MAFKRDALEGQPAEDAAKRIARIEAKAAKAAASAKVVPGVSVPAAVEAQAVVPATVVESNEG